jgi:hypothetical protein
MKELYDFLNENHIGHDHNSWNAVMSELGLALRSSPEILFSPSCGADTNPIGYFNRSWVTEIEGPGPDIIVRCDAMLYEPVCDPREGIFRILKKTAGIHVNRKDQRPTLHISKLKLPERQIWVIELFHTPNEDMLAFFLDNRISIRYLYSRCDGIMTGMGLHNVFSIPTIYYSYLYDLLKVGCHISDYIRPDIITYVASSGRHRDWKNALLHLADRLQKKHMRDAIYAAVSDDFDLPEKYKMIKLMETVENGFSRGRLTGYGMLKRTVQE